MRDAITAGFKYGLRQWRIALLVYALQLCLVLPLGMQVYHVLEASIGHSMSLSTLAEGYSHTVLMDFFKIHGASVTPLIGQLRWLILTYLLFAVGLDGGMLYCATLPDRSRVSDFWTGATTRFFPYLGIAVIVGTVMLIWTLLLWLPFLLTLEAALQWFPSEAYVVWIAVALMVVYGFGLLLLFAWSVAGRMAYEPGSKSIGRSLRQGWAVFGQQKRRVTVFLLFFMALQLVFLGLYLGLENVSGMISPGWILLFVLVQQMLVLFRISMRQMVYAGMAQLMHFTTHSNAA